MNLILNTDSYKMSHFRGYPEGLTTMHSYLESRGGKYPATLFFGLAPILEQLEKPIKAADVDEAEAFAAKHGVPFNRAGWDRIVNTHYGQLPVRIRAVPEGTLVPTGNVLLTIENTDPELPWLTSYLETMLLRVWYPTTVATRIYYMREKIRAYYEKTADTLDSLPFALLDFSSRGVSSLEQSQIGGAAYLMLFLGSDNVPAVDFVNRIYDSEMSGFSVPATEHSIMCSFGEENEQDSFGYLLEHMVQDGGILSVVSDTWNIYRACDYWASFAEQIKQRNITLVVRPDSGDIETVLPEVLRKLKMGFGAKTNSKGYDVLNNVKVLWGDGINESSCTLPFHIAERMGISSDSVMTGSGGGLMQVDINRDTCKFAIKGSFVVFDDGSSKGIAKNPITDPGKMSKQGRLALIKNVFGYETVSYDNEEPGPEGDLLQTVFVDGNAFIDDTVDTIRNRINQQ